MEINEVKAIVQEAEVKINDLKSMLADYDICKSAKSKMYLMAAMSKFATELAGNTQTAR